MMFCYTPKGVCSRAFEIELRDGVIEDVRIEGGCDGSLQGIISLVRGQPAHEVAGRLRGISCGRKQTSCPDQLAAALEEAFLLERGEERNKED